MPVNIVIRPSIAGDAEHASDIIRRAITEFCAPCYEHTPEVLTGWLRNKTKKDVESWIRFAGHYCVSAILNPDNAFNKLERKIVGFAIINRRGKVTVCHVDPEYVKHGVGSMLLSALEIKAAEWGLEQIHVGSPENARQFYVNRGFELHGECSKDQNILIDYPMIKWLYR